MHQGNINSTLYDLLYNNTQYIHLVILLYAPQIVCLSIRMLKTVEVFVGLQYSKCNMDFNYVYIFFLLLLTHLSLTGSCPTGYGSELSLFNHPHPDWLC